MRKITLLFSLLLLFTVSAMAQTLPQVSTMEAPIVYVIKNMRGGYMVWNANNSNAAKSSTLNLNALWYFIEDGNGYKIYNTESAQPLTNNSGTCKFQDGVGTTWYLITHAYSTDGFAISTSYHTDGRIDASEGNNTTCIDDANNGLWKVQWSPRSGDYQGTTFIIYTLNDLLASTIDEIEGMLSTLPGGRSFTNEAYEEFTAIKEFHQNISSTTTNDEIVTKILRLEELKSAMIVNLPVPGEFYRIKSYIKNATQESYKYHYVAANSATYTAVDAADETTVWLCQEGTTENRRKFVSYNVANQALAWLSIGATAYDFELGAGVENGTLYLKKNDAARYMGFTNEAYSTDAAKRGINSAAVGGGIDQQTTWSTDFIFEIAIAGAKEKASALAVVEGKDGLVGYPVASEIEAYKSIINNTENITISQIEAAKASLYASTNVNMPEDGKAYTFVNVQKDGTTFYVKYDEGTGITLSSNSADAEVFVCRKTDNDKYVFVNNSGKYFAHKGAGPDSYNGVNSNKGYTDSYDQTVDKYLNDFGIVKLTPSGVATTGNTDNIAVTNELLFGYVGLYTRRHDKDEDVYYIFKRSNGFDQANAPYCRYDLTSMVLIKPAEYANTPVLNNVTDKTLINIDGSMATFSAPFATVVPEGVTAYTATDNGNHVTLNAIEGAVPANTGVILAGAIGAGKVTMKPVTTETVATVGSNALAHSAGAAIELAEGQHYLLGAVAGVPGFYLSGAGTLAMNKAYLAIPTGGNSVVVRFPGTTGIDEVERESAQEVIYDLAGRRVEAMTAPGIYIVNGKKVLVK